MKPAGAVGVPANLSGQSIANRFSARYPAFRCVVCSGAGFVVLDDFERGYNSRHVLYKAGASHEQKYSDTVGIACDTCGLIYSFVLHMLHSEMRD